jgi:hypothetical protein
MCMQRKLSKTSEALARSQRQAKQADAEAEQMEKAFRVLQHEVSFFLYLQKGQTP